MDIIETENKHTSGLYTKQPIIIVRGQGASLWDADGNEYIDCAAGHGVANLGHAHPKVAAAIAEQSTQLVTLFETFYNDKRAALMDKITALVPGLDQVFFCNSGTEAVEARAQVRTRFHRAHGSHRGHARLPRAHHGGAFGHL